ncbi:MAG: tRNA preQ1(34) S-adenosylmethionine ribosyltransferase-isomerase QueA [Desulfovibrio sp.]|nr:MAG: tRNA preQ1(34) S-adenosylmethionine ribosyltransferase-isomerase QueA [Desulfovibrio sp.]
MSSQEIFSLSDYNYELPEDRIAQHPAIHRDESRLLVLNRDHSELEFSIFRDLAKWLPPGALLVANNTKVSPARLWGTKTSGGKVEFLLLTPMPLLEPVPESDGFTKARVRGLLRASKGFKPGDKVLFNEDFHLVVHGVGEFGNNEICLHWRGDLAQLLSCLGHMPLPPYIKRPDSREDCERYQTTYAHDNKAGSVAAPTAGLHFTPELRSALMQQGFEWAEVTLHVGYGTFSPIRCSDIRDHAMHEEYAEINRETARRINIAKEQGRPVIAVGTTSIRTLEGVFAQTGAIEPFSGWINLYIRPGFSFQVIDGCLTNFHLPKSSLLVMISALAGREQVLDAYAHALENGFRFFSYGDSMLII